jgi:hypothetical protein
MIIIMFNHMMLYAVNRVLFSFLDRWQLRHGDMALWPPTPTRRSDCTKHRRNVAMKNVATDLKKRFSNMATWPSRCENAVSRVGATMGKPWVFLNKGCTCPKVNESWGP